LQFAVSSGPFVLAQRVGVNIRVLLPYLNMVLEMFFFSSPTDVVYTSESYKLSEQQEVTSVSCHIT
jgi:hypothetical protein